MANISQTIANNTGGVGGSLVPAGQAMLSNLFRLQSQPGVRRALPAIIITALAIAGLAAFAILRQPDQMTLYAGLPESEKAAVIEALGAAGIPATLDRATGELVVPAADYHRARISLAGQGLPQSTPDGYASLTDMPMGTSRSVETVRLRRVQEQELARSIAEIQTITSARVHLAIPKASAFVRDPQAPRASVFVKVAQGRVLDRSQIEAIVNLVSSSVPKMVRSDVSVVDQAGRLLSSGSDDAATLLSHQQLQHRVRIEDLYRNRIEALVAPIAGLGNFTVQVNVGMDFTRSEITEERVDPDGNALRSEQESLNLSASPRAHGIPGAVSNTPPQAATLSATQASGTTDPASTGGQSSSSTRNYEVSRTIKTIVAPTSRVVRIDAAILLRESVGKNGKTEPLPDKVLQDIENLSRSAIGFDQSRGDSVTVTSQPFMVEFEDVSTIWYQEPSIQELARQAGMLVALAIIAIGVIRPLLNRLLVPVNPATLGSGSQPPFYGSDYVEVGEGDSLDDINGRLQPSTEQLYPALFESARTNDEKIAVVRKIAAEESDRVLSVFRTMMQDDRDTTQ
jgi:flagellar M-ring protein FliF